jgi:DNA polymerase III subunit delta'
MSGAFDDRAAMSFTAIIGQYRAKSILRRALEHERVAHAYLFTGPDGVGKEALAIEFAKALLCKSEQERPCDECTTCKRASHFQHPDFTFLFPSSSKTIADERTVLDSIVAHLYRRQRPWAAPTISIDQIRELRRSAILKPLEGRQVAVIAEADKMTIPATNALLKLLEEPPDSLFLILTSSQANSLLPTILSRCQEIRLGPLPDNEIEWALVEKEGMEPERARLLARISQGSYSRALEWADESFNERREQAVEFLRYCLKDSMSQIELVEALAQGNDKKFVKDILSLMLMWFRDALILQEQFSDGHKHLVNIDDVATLERFVAAFESIDFDAAFLEIEQSIQMVERNIHLQLVLIVLMIKLKNYMKLKGRTP